MSRRDTIIIALLVNAGLLALLFVLAVNTDDDMVADSHEITKAIADNRSQIPVNRPQAPIILVDTSVHDEVDSFLKDLAAEDPAQPLLIDEDGYVEYRPEVVATKPPAATRSAPATNGQNYVEVTVKRGDALEKIARSNGTSVEAIKAANNLTTAKLSIGQVLRVPISGKLEINAAKPAQTAVAQAPKETEKRGTTSVEAQYYTIKSGDNPWNIAKQFNVKFDDLLRLNNLDEERARNLKIGDKIRVK